MYTYSFSKTKYSVERKGLLITEKHKSFRYKNCIALDAGCTFIFKKIIKGYQIIFIYSVNYTSVSICTVLRLIPDSQTFLSILFFPWSWFPTSYFVVFFVFSEFSSDERFVLLILV